MRIRSDILQKLGDNFVHSMPRVPQSSRDGSLNAEFVSWANAFDTWMDQAQTPVEIAEGLYAVRIGPVITVTGTVRAGERIEGIGPAVTFSTGGVTFDSEGFIQGGSADVPLSVTFISRR